MTDADPTPLGACFARLAAGDPAARGELLRLTMDRLLAMVRQMLRRYPGVRRWEESDDVLQNVLVRLDRCLAHVPVRSAVDYFRLAATGLRRELIDLARHYYGPQGAGANQVTPAGGEPPTRPAAGRDDPAAAAAGRELHALIGALPDDLRTVAELHWYLGLSKAEVATALGLSLSTVKRRCVEAKLLLEDRLGP